MKLQKVQKVSKSIVCFIKCFSSTFQFFIHSKQVFNPSKLSWVLSNQEDDIFSLYPSLSSNWHYLMSHFSDEIYDKVFRNIYWVSIRILVISKPIYHTPWFFRKKSFTLSTFCTSSNFLIFFLKGGILFFICRPTSQPLLLISFF